MAPFASSHGTGVTVSLVVPGVSTDQLLEPQDVEYLLVQCFVYTYLIIIAYSLPPIVRGSTIPTPGMPVRSSTLVSYTIFL